MEVSLQALENMPYADVILSMCLKNSSGFSFEKKASTCSFMM